MGLWTKGLKRTESGEIRKGDDISKQIEMFFAERKETPSYEIKNPIVPSVDVNGNLHIYQSDLDEGKLFFKIGKLIGNLYFYGKHMSPSVIPDEMEGEIIIVPDEGVSSKSKSQNGNSEEDLDGLMHALSAIPPSKAKITKQIEAALTECLANNYDIDFQEILTRLKEEWENKDKYELRVVVKEIEYGNRNHRQTADKMICEFYVSQSGAPLKLSAIEKAVYILFILHKDGLTLNMRKNQIDLLRKIYNKLEDTVQDMENGIMNKDFLLRDTTLNGYRFHIRKEIQKQISNSKIVDEFAIEGYKGEPFKVIKATDEMRTMIREKFNLD